MGNRRNGQRPFQPLPQHQGGESHPAGLEGKAATPPPSTEGMGMWGGSRAADDPALPSWDVAAASRADADNAGMVVVVVVVGGVKGGAGGASNESANLGFPRGEGSGATYGARKALVAAPAAALAAAVRTAWLEKTPAANSSWAFWKLAPVRRYREWIWKRADSFNARLPAMNPTQPPPPIPPAHPWAHPGALPVLPPLPTPTPLSPRSPFSAL